MSRTYRDDVKVYRDDGVEARWRWLDRFVKGRWHVAVRTGRDRQWEPRTMLGYRDRADAERRARRVADALQRDAEWVRKQEQRANERRAESNRIARL